MGGHGVETGTSKSRFRWTARRVTFSKTSIDRNGSGHLQAVVVDAVSVGTKLTLRIASLGLAVVCAGTASFVAPAQSASSGLEEIHIRRGVELRRKGKNQEALPHFQKAYKMAHTARAAAQLGLCEQALQLWVAAQLHLSVALESESDPWVSQYRGTLEKARAAVEAQLGRVEVTGKPGGAVVSIAGNFAGNLPDTLSGFVLPGTVTVTVAADGFERFEETSEVTAGAVAKFEVLLRPLRRDPPNLAQGRAVPAEPDARVLGNPPPSQPQGRSGGSKVAAWSAVASGAALVGAGIYYGARASSLANDVRNGEMYDPSKEDSARSSRTISTICIGAGVVAVGVSAFLFYRTSEHSDVALLLNAPGTGALAAWRGTW